VLDALLDGGADLEGRAVPPGPPTTLDIATEQNADELVEWLRSQGATSATELG
jgi:hypothetical protein